MDVVIVGPGPKKEKRIGEKRCLENVINPTIDHVAIVLFNV